MAGPPMPPPGMHKNGGRAGFKRGGAVKDGPAWKEGLRNGTKPMNSTGRNDLADVNRPPAITKKTGGAVKSEGMKSPTIKHAAGGGQGRLEKMRFAKKHPQ